MSNPHSDLTQSLDDDPLIDGPLISQDALESPSKEDFQKLPTSWIAGLLSVLHVAYVAACVVLAALCWLTDTHSAECKDALSGLDPRSLVLLGKVVVWLLFLIFQRCMQHHHSAARRRGYLQFYRSNNRIQHLPLLIHSTGNAAVLVLVSQSTLFDKRVMNLSVYLLLVVIGVELLLSVVCLLVYAVRVTKFNSQSPGPDVSEEERSYAFSTSGTHTHTGFRDGSSLEDVVEKQADLIEYLKQHNTLLSKRILTLTSQRSRD